MLKKTLASAGIACLLVLGGAGAAFAADGYPPKVDAYADSVTLTPGQTTTLHIDDIPTTFTSAGFSLEGAGVTDATLTASAANGTDSINAPVVGGSVTATFTAPNVTSRTEYVIETGGGNDSFGDSFDAQIRIVVAPLAEADSGLPVTGGQIPASAIWLGVGALALGGIVLTAAVTRRQRDIEQQG